MVGDQVARGRAGVAVAVLVKPLGRGARAVAAVDLPRRTRAPRASVQQREARMLKRAPAIRSPGSISCGHAVDHDLADEPRPALGQAPAPEVGVQLDGARRLQGRGAEGWRKA